MHIHWFQHVPFEGLGLIEPWLRARGHRITTTRFYAGELPGLDAASCDWLIVMGGPMNIYQHRYHPWLRDEKLAIRACIESGARVLGICLGAQLIADVLGGRVYQNPECEIGWMPIRANPESATHPLAFPAGESEVFHWHGDTFDLPPGAVLLASSETCRNQAFALGPVSGPAHGSARIIGLQFHLEMDESAIRNICQNCADELPPNVTASPSIHTAESILNRTHSLVPNATALLHHLLDRMEQG